MYVPFYHEVGHGLYVSSGHLCWVTLLRSGSDVSLQAVRHVTVSESPAAALERLVDEVEPSRTLVGVHLDPSHVRFATGEVGRDDDRASALATIARRELPTGVPLEDFVLRSQPLAGENGGEEGGVIVAIARREAVEDRRALAESAGLDPVVVGDLRTDVGFAFAFDDAFADADSPVLLAHDDRGWLVRHRDGLLAAEPAPMRAGTDGMADEAVLALTGRQESSVPPPLRVVGSDAESAVAAFDGSSGGDRAVEVGVPEWVTGADPADVARAGPALSLAVATLYPDAGFINALDPEEVGAAREEADRRQGTRAVLAVCLVVAALLLVVTGVNQVIGQRIQSSEDQLAQLSSRLQQVDQARATRNELRRQLDQSRRLVADRTRMALLLERVGQAVPDGVWLEGVSLSQTDGGATRAGVEGYAVREADVADFLSNLERQQRLTDVQLVVSEILDAEDVYRRTETFRQSLTRFEIQLRTEL